jgi:hypothetical protein
LAGLNAHTLVGDPSNPRRAVLIHSLAAAQLRRLVDPVAVA